MNTGQVLGPFTDCLVVVGGWVPDQLLPDAEEPHIGSIDVDFALDAVKLREGRYAELLKLLLDTKRYKKGAKDFQLVVEVDLKDGERPVQVEVEFLAPKEVKRKKNKPKILADFRVLRTDACGMAFHAPVEQTISGRNVRGAKNSVRLRFASLADFIVMKAHAIGGREKPKDSYDLCYCLEFFPGGMAKLAADWKERACDKEVIRAFEILREKFATIDSFGPRQVVEFYDSSDADEQAMQERRAFELDRAAAQKNRPSGPERACEAAARGRKSQEIVPLTTNIMPNGKSRMKSKLSVATLMLAAALFGFTGGSALALTVPVAQDTYTSTSGTSKLLYPASGKAASLLVNAKQNALIRFDLTNLDVVPAAITPENIRSAILRLYVISAKPVGDLEIHAITSDWSENFLTKSATVPAITPAVIAAIPAAEIAAKEFVSVDVTSAVVNALQSGDTFGFAIETGSATAKIVLASKEGPATGCAAEIDIDAGFGGITGADIVDGSIGAAQLAAGAVGTGQLGSGLTLGGTTLGTFSGNGSGLMDVSVAASAVTGTLSATQIATPPPGMVLIPAGSFSMGDSLDGEGDAIPTVTATISAFYMDANLVSLGQWHSVYYWAKSNGYTDLDAGGGDGGHNPVYNVNWYDCVKWCNARSEQARLTPVYYTDVGFTAVYRTGNINAVFMNTGAPGYRLPTEAEWEKAARGGLSGQRFPWGNTIDETLANYYGSTGSYSYDLGPNGYNALDTGGTTNGSTTPVGLFPANGYGLFDMAGNVFEWCWDWYGTPYAGGSNPVGPVSGSFRVLRGGNWGYYANYARCAYRGNIGPTSAVNYFGFRSVLSPGQP